jgi:hypothetical protein
MNVPKPYEEIVDFIAAGSTPEGVAGFRPSVDAQQRVATLVERSKVGQASVAEQSELEDYLQLEHLMIMAKARARHFTQLAP